FAFQSLPRTGTSLAGLDTQCQNEATAGGLPGTYLAAVASPTQSIASRFSAGAPWVRPDGTEIAADRTTMFDTSTKESVIDQLADGTYTSNGILWTGAVNAGSLCASNCCTTWTDFGAASGEEGQFDDVNGSFTWGLGTNGCVVSQGVVCLQQ